MARDHTVSLAVAWLTLILRDKRCRSLLGSTILRCSLHFYCWISRRFVIWNGRYFHIWCLFFWIFIFCPLLVRFYETQRHWTFILLFDCYWLPTLWGRSRFGLQSHHCLREHALFIWSSLLWCAHLWLDSRRYWGFLDSRWNSGQELSALVCLVLCVKHLFIPYSLSWSNHSWQCSCLKIGWTPWVY